MVVSIDEPTYGKHWSNLSAVPSSREIIKRMLIKYDEIHRNIVKKPVASKKHNVQNHELSLSNYSKINKNIFPNFKGKTLKEAFDLAVEVENLAKQYWKILLSGRAKLLSISQMQTVLKKFKSYGKQKIDR